MEKFLLIVLFGFGLVGFDSTSAFQLAWGRQERSRRASVRVCSSALEPPPAGADLAVSIPSLLILNKPSPTTRVTSEGLAKDILETQDAIQGEEGLVLREALKLKRYLLLCSLLEESQDDYYRVASFLAESKVYEFGRWDAPNVQGFGLRAGAEVGAGVGAGSGGEDFKEYEPPPRVGIRERVVDGVKVTGDSELMKRNDRMSAVDGVLLWVFRKLVGEETGLGMGETKGMEGLVEQGRDYMIKTNQEDTSTADEKQVTMVRNTLRRLMGPIKPIYRLFMAGIVPAKVGEALGKEEWKDKQVFKGGLFYAPFLTSLVTPLFFQWLVGPARTSRRSDGTRGGVVVEKCRFLEISNCKGLCLHLCKSPAEQFFGEELGVSLYVQPNFESHECHWNWGEEAPDGGVRGDEAWPKGCLEGCSDRKKVAAIAERGAGGT
ncbi:hypothetical protein TrST_g8645 [Triparma strigata]|uniref:Beta-carotene isomerase D27-like C-terminal domain-containing protein n=1 Tax=Triparma strigata TaxID=1606541 RepID=A0A9W7B3S8_9STRA|nr:hypothetical protein TrST_g8645 [Triparma strigata]